MTAELLSLGMCEHGTNSCKQAGPYSSGHCM